jgi:hypothetical protein
MWTARYNRPIKDIFAVQDEIVRKVVTTLGLVLTINFAGGFSACSTWPRAGMDSS